MSLSVDLYFAGYGVLSLVFLLFYCDPNDLFLLAVLVSSICGLGVAQSPLAFGEMSSFTKVLLLLFLPWAI